MKLILFQGQVEAEIEALGFDRFAIYRPGWVSRFTSSMWQKIMQNIVSVHDATPSIWGYIKRLKENRQAHGYQHLDSSVFSLLFFLLNKHKSTKKQAAAFIYTVDRTPTGATPAGWMDFYLLRSEMD